MKYSLLLLLLSVGNVIANEYQDFYRADFEGRQQIARANGKDASEYVLNIHYAFPQKCNKLEYAGNYHKRDSVSFIPCEYSKPYFAKEASSSYLSAIIYNDDGTAFIMNNARYGSRKPFYLYLHERYEEPVKKMVEKGKRYSVLLFPEYEPNVEVY